MKNNFKIGDKIRCLCGSDCNFKANIKNIDNHLIYFDDGSVELIKETHNFVLEDDYIQIITSPLYKVLNEK